jgi:hypothetical protein
MANLSIQGIIDLAREAIREISDDTNYPDKYIYRIILEARAELLDQMKKQNKELSPWLFQRFCLKLCPSTFIECGCAPFGFECTVYKSVNPLPQPIGNDALSLNISELFGDHINRVTERQFRTLKYRKYKPPYYYYIGDVQGKKHLFILSEGSVIPPKYIKAEGIFEDPSDVLEFACTDAECSSLSGTGFPFTLAKESALIKMVVTSLTASKKLPEDLANDAKSVPDQLII